MQKDALNLLQKQMDNSRCQKFPVLSICSRVMDSEPAIASSELQNFKLLFVTQDRQQKFVLTDITVCSSSIL